MPKQIKVIINRPFGAIAILDGHIFTGLSPVFGPKGAEAFLLGNTLYVKDREKIPLTEEIFQLPSLQIPEMENFLLELPDILTVDGTLYFAYSHIERRLQTAEQPTISSKSIIQRLEAQIADLEHAHAQEILNLKTAQKEILEKMVRQCEIVNKQLKETEAELIETDRQRELLLLQVHKQLEEYKKMAEANANLPEIAPTDLEELPHVPVEEMVKEIAALQQQKTKLEQDLNQAQEQITDLRNRLTELAAALKIQQEKNDNLQSLLETLQPSSQSVTEQDNKQGELINTSLEYEVVSLKQEEPDNDQLLTKAFYSVLIVFTLHFKKEAKDEKEPIAAIIDKIIREIHSILNGSYSLILDYPFTQEANVVIDYFKQSMQIQDNNDFGLLIANFSDQIKHFLAEFLRDLLSVQSGPQRVNTINELKAAYEEYLKLI